MALRASKILGPDGEPFLVKDDDEEIAGPTTMGVRSTQQIHPSIGLSPAELASILRAAEDGDAERYLALAEDIEEKYPHYAAVLSTRKLQVSQLEIKIDAVSDAARDVEIADFVRAWFERPQFETELFDLLDAIGKGYAVQEIMWDTSERQWLPAELVWRDPSWFQFDRVDRTTLRLRELAAPDGVDLPPGHFVIHRHKAKSGIPIRAGLARLVAWSWMFQNFSIKDWASFAETYGQPLRVGKYPPSASADEKRTLLRAVSGIAGDAAAVIPETMTIEFVKGAIAGDGGVFKNLAQYCDHQVSKAVLGQTATTDAIAGGHAVGKEHNEVRGDIERSDARQLAATASRDLVRWIVSLNFGPQKRYPIVRIGRAEEKDVEHMLRGAELLADRGARVSVSQIRDAVGLDEPDEGDELLGPVGGAPSSEEEQDDDTETKPPTRKPKPKAASNAARFDRLRLALNAGGAKGAATAAKAAQARQREQDEILAALEETVGPITEGWLEKIQAAVNEAADLESLASRLVEIFPTLGVDDTATVIGQALALGNVAARDLSIEG